MQTQSMPTPQQLKRASTAEPIVLDGVRPDLCADLEQIVLLIAERGGSGRSLNKGGWKSPDQQFLKTYGRQYQAVQQLLFTLQEMVGATPTQSWAMINSHGSSHPLHQHRGAIVTSVFYVTAGDPLTPTTFRCADKSELEVAPHPGRLVISPGEMWHKVPPYVGEAPRITIACDFRSAR